MNKGSININDLQGELITHAESYDNTVTELVNVTSKYNKLITNQKTTEASLVINYLTRPEDFGLKVKPTVKLIDATILLQEDMVRIGQELQELKEQKDLLAGTIETLRQKKYMLLALTDLITNK
jgi:hypothetical protein